MSGFKPVMVYELVVMGALFKVSYLPPSNKYTLYPVAPGDGVQESVVLPYSVLENVRFAGLAGAVVAIVDLVLEFPAISVAFTLAV